MSLKYRVKGVHDKYTTTASIKPVINTVQKVRSKDLSAQFSNMYDPI